MINNLCAYFFPFYFSFRRRSDLPLLPKLHYLTTVVAHAVRTPLADGSDHVCWMCRVDFDSPVIAWFPIDALQAGASQFEQAAGKLKNKMWWKNAKVYLLSVVRIECIWRRWSVIVPVLVPTLLPGAPSPHVFVPTLLPSSCYIYSVTVWAQAAVVYESVALWLIGWLLYLCFIVDAVYIKCD